MTSAGLSDYQKSLVTYVLERLGEFNLELTYSPEIATAVQCLTDAFISDTAIPSTLPSDLKAMLDDLWNETADTQAMTVEEAAENPDSSQDEKLNEFLELLRVRGYFSGVELDSEEYNLRLKKAINKFHVKQNPFANMTSDEIKAKGNAHMIAAKYDDAIECYTKAIEVAMQSAEDSTSDGASQLHVYYANRAAAHIELKKYTEATEDCGKSISHKSDYAKAFARLGVAHYYLSQFEKSADAYERALELDAGNEKYRQDMEDARAKAKEVGSTSAQPNLLQNLMGGNAAGGADPLASLFGNNPQMKQMMESLGGLPGGGAGGDFPSAMANMTNNPQFMQLAQSFMQNPQFSNMVQGFAQQFAQGAGQGQNGNPMVPDLSAMQNFFDPSMSGIDSEALRDLRESEIQNNPKMREISEDVRLNGPGVFTKYMNDPDVMNLMTKFSGLFGEKNSQEQRKE